MENKNNKVILLHSYKGGTGKSAIALNLANFLAKNKKVLLIEQDISGPTFADVFQIQPVITWNDFYQNHQIKDLIINLDNFDIIFAKEGEIPIPEGQSLKIFFQRNLERLNKQLNSLKQNYNYIIFDTHPGYNVEIINNLLVSDFVILLTRLDSDMIIKTIELYNKLYSQFKSKKVIFVENMVPIPEKEKDYEKIMKKNNFREIMENWKEFSKNISKVTIPLNNDIAYGLFINKLLEKENTFIKYISEIADHF